MDRIIHLLSCVHGGRGDCTYVFFDALACMEGGGDVRWMDGMAYGSFEEGEGGGEVIE